MADSHHKIRGYLRQNGETNMQKYTLDDIVGLTNWGYTIAKPTTAMLAAVPRNTSILCQRTTTPATFTRQPVHWPQRCIKIFQ